VSKIRTFAVNAGVLTLTSLSLGAAGVVYNAWLTRNLGSAGMGLFSLMMAVYRLAVTFASSGSGLAATRIVAEETAVGHGGGAAVAMRKTIIYALLFGLGGMALLCQFSGAAAGGWVGDMRAEEPFRILSLSLPFVGVAAAFTGYFTAVMRVTPAALVQIFEQLSQMAFTVSVFAVLKPDTLAEGCVLVAAGSTVSEAASFLLFWLFYRADRKRHPLCGGILPRRFEMWKRVAGIAMPVGASAVLRSALSTVKHLLVPASLQKFGLTEEEALSSYGIVGGMVLPVLISPCAFLLGFSNLLVPEIARYKELGRRDSIFFVIRYTFRLTLIFSVAVAALLTVFSKELAVLLYGSEESAAYIRALGPLVIVMYLDSSVDGVLKGLGEQVAVVRINVMDTAICVMLVWLLVPLFGLRGYMMMIVISEIFNMILSAGRLVYVTGFRADMPRWAVVPFLGAFGAVFAAKYGMALLGFDVAKAGGILLAFAAFLLLYYMVLRLTGCLTQKDLALFARVFRK